MDGMASIWRGMVLIGISCEYRTMEHGTSLGWVMIMSNESYYDVRTDFVPFLRTQFHASVQHHDRGPNVQYLHARDTRDP